MSDVLVRRLEDEDINLEIMGDYMEDKTLEEALKYVKALKGHNTTSTTMVSSSYRRQHIVNKSGGPRDILTLNSAVTVENTATDAMYRNT